MIQNNSSIHLYMQLILSGACIIFACLLWLGMEQANFSFEEKENNIKHDKENMFLALPSIENTIPNIDEFEEMINRPLFFESRQPFVFEEIVEQPTTKKKKTNTRRKKP